MANREEHLRQFPDMPEAIWAAHRRVAEAVKTSEG
jgi:phosphoenolpyruvate carboxykinase (GTP)